MCGAYDTSSGRFVKRFDNRKTGLERELFEDVKKDYIGRNYPLLAPGRPDGQRKDPLMCPDGRPGGHPVYTPLKMCREAGIRYCKFLSLGVMFLPRLDR